MNSCFSYLAETPLACREKVRELLEFMLSIEGEDEPRPFFSICFLLPMLCQITMEIEGCKILVSCGGQKAVVECLIKLIGPNGCMIEDKGCIFLACDTILNLLLKRDQIKFQLDESTSVHLLKALAYWTGIQLFDNEEKGRVVHFWFQGGERPRGSGGGKASLYASGPSVEHPIQIGSSMERGGEIDFRKDWLTLIRSMLSSLPIYCMSLLVIPRKVSLRHEKIHRDFLWGGGALERKPHMINCVKVSIFDLQSEEGIWVSINKETDEPSIVMMASSICALIFDHTSEQALLNHPNIDHSTIASLSQLIVRSLATCAQNMGDDMKSDLDLLDIVTAGLSNLFFHDLDSINLF
ncbi:hypothetical protein AAG906_017173 [Vitis piasezkii]